MSFTMRDSLELFEKTLEDYAKSRNVQNHLLDLIANLYKELENERNTTSHLQQQIIKLSGDDAFGITYKFATLKAEYNALKEKLSALKNQNEDLNIQLIGMGQETKQRLAEKEDEMKSIYSDQLKQKDIEIQEKEKETEKMKESFKQKEQELYNEIQAIEVSSAMELDKVESNFRQQYNESTKKLKDSVDTCNVLRVELMSVKEQYIEYKRTASERIAELQKRLREYPNSSSLSFSKQRQESSRNNLNNVCVNSEDTGSKYEPLDVSFKNFSSPDDKPVNLKKPTLSRPIRKHTLENSNSTLPPLINLQEKNRGTNPANKRRKLYNPNDYTYFPMDVSDKDV